MLRLGPESWCLGTVRTGKAVFFWVSGYGHWNSCGLAEFPGAAGSEDAGMGKNKWPRLVRENVEGEGWLEMRVLLCLLIRWS